MLPGLLRPTKLQPQCPVSPNLESHASPSEKEHQKMWRLGFGRSLWRQGSPSPGGSIRHVSLSASTPAFENSTQLDKQVELALFPCSKGHRIFFKKLKIWSISQDTWSLLTEQESGEGQEMIQGQSGLEGRCLSLGSGELKSGLDFTVRSSRCKQLVGIRHMLTELRSSYTWIFSLSISTLWIISKGLKFFWIPEAYDNTQQN